jgi:hypothetical protein
MLYIFSIDGYRSSICCLGIIGYYVHVNVYFLYILTQDVVLAFLNNRRKPKTKYRILSVFQKVEF